MCEVRSQFWRRRPNFYVFISVSFRFLYFCFLLGKDEKLQSACLYTCLFEHMPYMITQCYLPPDRGDIPALVPAEADTRLSDPGGMQD